MISRGTKITVTAEGTTVDMDPVILPDTQIGANGAFAGGITNFSVNIQDLAKSSDPDNRDNKSTTLRVTVSSPLAAYGTIVFDLASGIIDP